MVLVHRAFMAGLRMGDSHCGRSRTCFAMMARMMRMPPRREEMVRRVR